MHATPVGQLSAEAVSPLTQPIIYGYHRIRGTDEVASRGEENGLDCGSDILALKNGMLTPN
jgi:hypothetical protein